MNGTLILIIIILIICTIIGFFGDKYIAKQKKLRLDNKNGNHNDNEDEKVATTANTDDAKNEETNNVEKVAPDNFNKGQKEAVNEPQILQQPIDPIIQEPIITTKINDSSDDGVNNMF